MKLSDWLCRKIEDAHSVNSHWKLHPIWNKYYIKVPITHGCGSCKLLSKYLQKKFEGFTVKCQGIELRIGALNMKTGLTLWKI